MKIRLDKLLMEKGLVASRERAQALILAGRVLVDTQKVEKCGTPVEREAEIRLIGERQRYVGRGGLKLEAALHRWRIDLTGRRCVDIGASTGGFTDCMLQHAAAGVVAIDTGYGQIAEPLRREPRVALMERTNARHLPPGSLASGITFMAMDVSFISATLLLPVVIAAIHPRLDEGESRAEARALQGVILVKPQFEAGREFVGKGGIVRDPEGHRLAVMRVRNCVEALGGSGVDLIDSPILGSKGNREFLLYAHF